MQSTDVMAPYNGTRPSPAKRWAPAVIVAVSAAALGNAVLVVLNLIERNNLERAKAGHPVSRAFFEDTLSAIRGASRLTGLATLAFVVVGIVWSVKRRSARKVRDSGEMSVEPRLASISGRLYVTFWVVLFLAFATSQFARSQSHVGMTISDVINYRGFVATAELFRIAMWAAYAALVVKATRRQEQRELLTSAPV